uniref:Uncharacterized protein n=1 Tax=Rhizophora mucronata TaxID=61149 RepID=A0A2P2NK51_RHIMU
MTGCQKNLYYDNTLVQTWTLHKHINNKWQYIAKKRVMIQCTIEFSVKRFQMQFFIVTTQKHKKCFP